MGKEKHDTKENGLRNGLPQWLVPNRSKSAFVLIGLTLMSLFFASQLGKLQFNYSFNSFFPEGDDELEYYEQFNQEFGQFNDFLFVVLKSEEVFSEAFRSRISQLESALSKLPSTESITNPFNLKGIQINPLGINSYPLIGDGDVPNKERLEQYHLYGNFLGKDDQSVMLFVRHHEFSEKRLGDEYFLEVQNLIEESGFTDSIVSGKIQMQYDFTQKLENELGNLLLVGLVVTVLILIVLFRSFKGLLLSLLILILTLIWTMGLMAWTGKPIDVMVIMIPAILLIVSLSDVIHFAHKYDDYLSKGHDHIQAIKQTVLTIGKATFLTSSTTAIGFLGLIFLPIQPIREFGMLTAAGVIMAFVITFLALPSILFFLPARIEKRFQNKFQWTELLTSAHQVIVHNKKLFLIGLATISLLLIAGIPSLRLSTSIIVGLQKNEPELQKVAYFDRYFDGYKPFELGLELEEPIDKLDEGVLKKIAQIEAYLTDEYGVKHIQSPLNILKEINAGLNGGSRKYYSIPEKEDLNRVSRFYKSPRLQEARNQVQSVNGKLVRIIGRVRDFGSAYYHPKNDSLKTYLNTMNEPGFEARLTGASYLIDKTDSYVVSSLLKGIAFAMAAVSIFILVFFKSLKLAFYTLVPNLLPMAILFGLMGWLGVDLNISTAIIFTVALGIAIDDSIHFIARYKLERELHDKDRAIKNAFTGTGKSIVVTSLVIILGFSVFLISGFSAAYYLGFFIVLAAIVALVFDLILLPILLKK